MLFQGRIWEIYGRFSGSEAAEKRLPDEGSAIGSKGYSQNAHFVGAITVVAEQPGNRCADPQRQH